MTDEQENQMIQAAWRIYRKYKGEYHRPKFWRNAADDMEAFLEAYSGYWQDKAVHDFAYRIIYVIFQELNKQFMECRGIKK